MVRDDGTRGRILDAAVRLIRTKDYQAMNINDVRRATGLTKGARLGFWRLSTRANR